MPITKSISSLSNVKQLTGADSPQNPGSLVTYTYGPATSTAGQTIINLGFSVSTTNTTNFFLWIDGKLLSLGSSNDYTFTNIQSNGTSSQVTLNAAIVAGLNINATYLGVLIPNAASTSILTINSEIATLNTTTFQKINVQVFTSNGTYTPSTGMLYATVEVIGGGGGGGGISSAGAASSAGGGGAGAYSKGTFSATTIGSSQIVTVGAAGTAGTTSGGGGGSGGTSSFGSLIASVGGGSGGNGSTGVGSNSGGAGGTAGTGGNINIAGQHGSVGVSFTATGASGTTVFGGSGGSTPYGFGSPVGVSTPNPATGYGAGGGGASGNSTAVAGAAGTAGIVIITEYLY